MIYFQLFHMPGSSWINAHQRVLVNPYGFISKYIDQLLNTSIVQETRLAKSRLSPFRITIPLLRLTLRRA